MQTCNMNSETGIHYGVIPKNDLFNCAEEFYDNAEDETFKEISDDLAHDLKGILENWMPESDMQDIIDQAIERMNENYENDHGLMIYKKDGYEIHGRNDDTDLFVIKSPYYTMVRECSPCAPNAGYLRDYPGPLKTYCLPDEWFDDEYSKCPYEKIYSVETNEEILTRKQ